MRGDVPADVEAIAGPIPCLENLKKHVAALRTSSVRACPSYLIMDFDPGTCQVFSCWTSELEYQFPIRLSLTICRRRRIAGGFFLRAAGRLRLFAQTITTIDLALPFALWTGDQSALKKEQAVAVTERTEHRRQSICLFR